MAITLFASLVPPAEDTSPAADRVTHGEPRATTVSLHESPDGRVLAGTWTCSPGRWRVAYDETEYCYILAGSGALIDASGSETRIGPGDEFVVPAGFVGEWSVGETMTKRYVMVLP